MTDYFFDASAVDKLYWKERGTESVKDIFQDASNTITISNLAVVELVDTLNARKNEGAISEYDIMLITGRFVRDMVKRIIVTPLYDDHISLSCDLVLKHNLDATGAIQLAIALMLPSNITFVTTDSLLIKAAEAEGMKALNPEE